MTRIEQREKCLRRIQARLQRPIKVKTTNATGSKVLKARYHIGESENVYKHIGTFLQNNAGDPAIVLGGGSLGSLMAQARTRQEARQLCCGYATEQTTKRSHKDP